MAGHQVSELEWAKEFKPDLSREGTSKEQMTSGFSMLVAERARVAILQAMPTMTLGSPVYGGEQARRTSSPLEALWLAITPWHQGALLNQRRRLGRSTTQSKRHPVTISKQIDPAAMAAERLNEGAPTPGGSRAGPRL